MTTQQKTTFWLIGLIIFVLMISLLGPVLLPFVAGMAVAYFLDPICDWLESHGFSRTIATTIVTLTFTFIVALFLALVGPLLVGEIHNFIVKFPEYLAAIERKSAGLVLFLKESLGIDNLDDLSSRAINASSSLLSGAGGLLKRVASGVNAVADVISFLVLTPIVAFYFLRDWDRMVAKVDSWLPRKQLDMIRQQCRDIDCILSGFVRGQSLVCFSLGGFYAIGLMFVGLDFGLVIGLFTGLVSFIPYFGMLLGFGVGIAVALAQFDSMAMVGFVALIFGIGQILEGYVLTPRLIGNRVGLHPVWIIFSLMAGGALFGFLGILIAVPIMAVLGVLARFALGQYMASPLYGVALPSEPVDDEIEAAPED